MGDAMDMSLDDICAQRKASGTSHMHAEVSPVASPVVSPVASPVPSSEMLDMSLDDLVQNENNPPGDSPVQSPFVSQAHIYANDRGRSPRRKHRSKMGQHFDNAMTRNSFNGDRRNDLNGPNGDRRRRRESTNSTAHSAKRLKRLEEAQDPRDLGNLPSHLLPLSRDLAHFLRHCAGKDEFPCLNPQGWIAVRILQTLRFRTLHHVSNEDLDIVVRESYSKQKRRFEFRDNRGEKEIRAVHNHSLNVSIDTPAQYPTPTSARNGVNGAARVKGEMELSPVSSPSSDCIPIYDVPEPGTRMRLLDDFAAGGKWENCLDARKGEVVTFLRGDGEWSRCRNRGNEEAWLPAGYLKKVEDMPPPPKMPPPRLKRPTISG